MMRKAVKESKIANHLADNTIKDYEPLDFDFPNENVLLVEEEKKRQIGGQCILMD